MLKFCFSVAPEGYFSKAGAKVLLFFELTKYFGKKMKKSVFFLQIWQILRNFAAFFEKYERTLYNFIADMLERVYDVRMVWPSEDGRV